MPPKSELIKNLVADGRALRASDFRDAGVSSSELTRSIERGDVVQWARGIYCGPDIPNGMSYAAVTLRHPGGVVCMQSAAAIHGISDLNPSQVWYAIDRSKNRAAPTGVNRDPVRMLSWTGPAMTVGVGPMKFAGVDVLVTNAARTVVDLLRRSIKAGAVGNEQTMKTLSDFVREGGDLDDVWEYAKALGCLEQIEPIVQPPPRCRPRKSKPGLRRETMKNAADKNASPQSVMHRIRNSAREMNIAPEMLGTVTCSNASCCA